MTSLGSIATVFFALIIGATSVGCIFIDDDDPPPPCPLQQGLIAVELLRDPGTGQCVEYTPGGGGGGGCNNEGAPADPIPPPDHAICYAFCEGLGETTCRDTDACRAVYVDLDCPGGNCEPTYFDCWGVAPSGPVTGGDCTQLGADECSRHNDCVAIHDEDCVGAPDECGVEIGAFNRCEPEVLDPGAGDCYGEPACDVPPPDCPSGTLAGHDGDCWTGYCIPVDQCEPAPACGGLGEAACVADAGCDPTYTGLDCSCDETGGCTCQSWQFHDCR